jgi:dTDP-4-dehydrorhamnose 3,5-epimerase
VRIEQLAVGDAWLCSPQRHDDERGSFLEWFRADLLERAVGRQANHSVSRRGTLRGLHYADVPPGQAKLVYCPHGAVLDVVVDVRLGSPTFGAHSAVRLGSSAPRAVFLAEGLAHAFCVLTDDADITYLVSTTYDPAVEHRLDPFDGELAIEWPADVGDLVLAPQDATAPTLSVLAAAGKLPSYDACRAIVGGATP